MIDTLVSVPPHLCEFIESAAGRNVRRRLADSVGRIFVGTDPHSRRLGSGGGTVNLLHAAWRATSARSKAPLEQWIRSSQRLVIHAGGESRRLPGYASVGKACVPLPDIAGLYPRRFDQQLLDFQAPTYRRVLKEAGAKIATLVTSGDVWLDFDPLQVPVVSADIVGIGMRVSPEVAQHFGVYFVTKGGQRSITEYGITFFRQKPALEEIYRHANRYDFYVDTGMWLLSAKALDLLFRRCGWSPQQQVFATDDGHAEFLDLYTEIGAAFGTNRSITPTRLKKLGWSQLTTSVLPLDNARFYHLGSTRQLFESLDHVQHGQLSPQRHFRMATATGVAQAQSTASVWLDAVDSSHRINLDGLNVVTGLPALASVRQLKREWCVEVSPTGRDLYVVRPYHLDDTLRGSPDGDAKICGRDARSWLKARSLESDHADIFHVPIYPVLAAKNITQALIEWFFAEHPANVPTGMAVEARLVSAAEIPNITNFKRLFAQRRKGYSDALKASFAACIDYADVRVFEQDFAAIAAFCESESPELKKWILRHHRAILSTLGNAVHQARLLALCADLSAALPRRRFHMQAQQRLRSSMTSANRIEPSHPRLGLQEDQIVWSRSPVRLDLAGGWTDTPPYCLDAGGSVLNVAVLLNGQPPIQAFVRPIQEHQFVLRSIDLGSTEHVASYKQLANVRDPKSNFSLAKASLALAGFHPDFRSGKARGSLKAELRAFGGGLEISLLSAVPKGSGLGTSSILAATVLAALNRACSLGWTEVDLYKRVLGVEQLLTTGGGWQDQAGALFRGLKWIQTAPGMSQNPTVSYLPAQLLGPDYANRTIQLYYTGITRLAKGILQEIVEDMLRSRSSTLRTLSYVRSNALHLYHALQQSALEAVQQCIARSWQLNKQLDEGTSTPDIERIIALCGEDAAACKLLGAGGGGYMLIFAKDPTAGERIRTRLKANPPNSRSRFIDFQVAERALEVTVS